MSFMYQSNVKMDQKDMVFVILTRLPAKSLIRFLCVSKSWCHLISKDSSFIHHHLQFHTAHSDALLFLPYPERSKTKVTSINYLSLGTSEHQKIKFPWSRMWVQKIQGYYDPYRRLFIAGHCNGLVCISDAHKVIMWNPVVRRFKILPDTDDFNDQLETKNVYGRQCEVQTVIGFGFVPSRGNADHESYYKVVRMTYTSVQSTLSRPDYPSIGELYDSRTDSWRRIGDENLQCLSIKEFTNSSTFVDGSLYWLGDRYRTKEEEEASGSDFPYYYSKLTAFSLVDEKFRNVKLPESFDLEIDFGKKLDGLGESQLGLFAGDHRHNFLLTIWAMKTDQLSWTKLYRINLDADPLCFSRNGEVLLRMRYSKLVQFDPKLQDPCHFHDHGYNVNLAVDYTESLLLLDGERGEEEETTNAEETERHVVEVEEEDLLGFDLFD